MPEVWGGASCDAAICYSPLTIHIKVTGSSRALACVSKRLSGMRGVRPPLLYTNFGYKYLYGECLCFLNNIRAKLLYGKGDKVIRKKGLRWP